MAPRSNGAISGLGLIEAAAEILGSAEFAAPIDAFVESECIVFEPPELPADDGPLRGAKVVVDSGEGFDHALADVQARYARLVAATAEPYLDALGASWASLQAALLDHPDAPPTRVVRRKLACCADFNAFFDMMAEANLALEARALALWHMQTDFGFDDDDLAAEDAAGGPPLPGAETLRVQFGLSERTVRELEAARAAAGGGGGGMVARLGELVKALGVEASDDDAAAAPAAAAPAAAPLAKPAISVREPSTSLLAARTSGLGSSGALGGRASALEVAVPSGTSSITGATSAPRASDATSLDPAAAAAAAPRSARPARVKPSLVAGPLSAPVRRPQVLESPRVTRPGDPDYDETAILELGESRWRIGRQIGRGATARVFLAVDLDRHRSFAVKQILISQSQPGTDSAAALAELEREIVVMRRLAHPNLVRFLGTERTADELYIAMEYIRGGALTDLIKRIASQQSRQRQQKAAAADAAAAAAPAGPAAPTPAAAPASVVLPLRTIASYTAQIVCGLSHLHAHGIIHRDIKSANILVDATYQHVKIADFGSARELTDFESQRGRADAEGAADGVQTLKGTPFWMAPEVIQGTGYGRKADVWSVGCVCVEMLTGRPPWSSELGDKAHPYAIMYHIVNAAEPPEFPPGLPGHIGEAMHLMFERDTDKRPSARELLAHEWLTCALPDDLVEPPSPLKG